MNIDDDLRRGARAHRLQYEQAPIPTPPAALRRRAPAVIGALAAGTAVVVVAVAVDAGHPSTHRLTVTSSETSTTAAAHAIRDVALGAAPMLVPAWTPAGLDLWSATSTTSDRGSDFPFQVFGTVGTEGAPAPGVLFTFQRLAPLSNEKVTGASSARVRGTDAAVDAAKEGVGTQITWIEGNTQIGATFRGVTTDQAVVMLDALHTRSGDPTQGFDPATAPAGYGLLAEDLTHDSSRVGVDATLAYVGSTPGPGADIEIDARTNSGAMSFWNTWIGGNRAPDGAAVEPDSYGAYRSMTIAWRDGRWISVRSTSANPATLERIARSAHLLPAGGTDAVVAGVDRRLANLPTLGTASLDSATVELHGRAQRVAVCVRFAAIPVCRANLDPNDPTAVSGEMLADGRWLVFGASSTGAPILSPNEPTLKMAALPSDTATIGQWHVALATVDPSIPHVYVSTPSGPNSWAITTMVRPNATR